MGDLKCPLQRLGISPFEDLFPVEKNTELGRRNPRLSLILSDSFIIVSDIYKKPLYRTIGGIGKEGKHKS